MPYIQIAGDRQLCGELTVQGSKNASLPIMAASLLMNGETTLVGCPRISDVYDMQRLLEMLGCKCEWHGDKLKIDASDINTDTIYCGELQRSRSVVYFIGAMLARTGRVTIPFPGGCTIGARPIDYHIDALSGMNAQFEEHEADGDIKFLSCSTTGLKAGDICFVKKSVGATQNTILAAVCTEGVTTIDNAACEPEVSALCDFLNHSGAKITGAGTKRITIKGVKKLECTEYRIPGDRIVAGTYMAAVAASGGEILLKGIDVSLLKEPSDILIEAGCKICCSREGMEIGRRDRLRAVSLIDTKPYPGFPTDLQSQFMAVLTLAQGVSRICENIFEERYKIVPELVKLGADIELDGSMAKITGVPCLYGTHVEAKDLRGGAALVIAGMAAQGETIVENTIYIERGYEDLCGDLRLLGARVWLCEN